MESRLWGMIGGLLGEGGWMRLGWWGMWIWWMGGGGRGRVVGVGFEGVG